MSCAWEYLTIDNVNFDDTWNTVEEIILKNFAGDPVEGVPSPSVQNTIYLSQRDILAAIKEVNIHSPSCNSDKIIHLLTAMLTIFIAKIISILIINLHVHSYHSIRLP